MNLQILDTTLRDGALAGGVNLSTTDKLRIAPLIASLGVTYLECGWASVFPKDLEFFAQVSELNLPAKLVAFGATRRPETLVQKDKGLETLLACNTPTVSLYGKVWGLHIEKVLRTTLEENLKMLSESVHYLRAAGREVILMAEHFFDALRDQPEYALQFVKTALEAGASSLVLADSNGSSLPADIAVGVKKVLEFATVPVGVHLHNDFGLALANALAALEAGASHLQGSVNGYGARNGITDLTALLPILRLRLGLDVVSAEQLARITPVALEVAALVGKSEQMDDAPFVGRRVFEHKTDTHIAAVLSSPQAYEPVPPESVGNVRRLIIPSMGKPAYLARVAEQYGIDLSDGSASSQRILVELKRLEDNGYSFEDAPASLELALKQLTGEFHKVLSVERVRLFDAIRGRDRPVVEASLSVRVGSEEEYVAAEASGPVKAFLKAIKAAISLSEDKEIAHYASRLEAISLRVRSINQSGEELRVRAAITISDGQRDWTCIGISQDLLQACWRALVDAVEYGMATR
ncbi:MAG: citramalate synthase [Deinococcales bacterium]